MVAGIPNVASVGAAVLPNVNPAQWTRELNNVLPGIAGKAAAAAGAAIVGGLAASVGTALKSQDLFVEFESSLTRITTLVGIAKEEVDGFGQEILSLAPEVGRAPKELADALFFVTSAGLRGSDALDTLEASAKAAALGLGQTEVVADAATSALNAYGPEVLSAEDAVGVLVKTVEQGKLEADSLAGSIGRVIPIASEAGVSFNEVGAALAAVSRTGLDASEGATALRGILATVIRPTQQAKEALGAYGITTEDLARTLREDGLLALLDLLRNTVGDNTEALATIVPNIRALTGFLSLTGSGAAETARIFRELEVVTGVLDDRFASLQETQAFRRQQAEAERLAILTGEGSEAAEALTQALEQIPGVLEDIVPLLVDVGTALLNLGGDALGGVARVAEYFSGLGESGFSAADGITAAGVALGVMTGNPVVAGVAAIAGALQAIGSNEKRLEAVGEAFLRIGASAGDLEAAAEAAVALVDAFDEDTGFIDQIIRGAADIGPILTDLGLGPRDFANAVDEAIASGRRFNALNINEAFGLEQNLNPVQAVSLARALDDTINSYQGAAEAARIAGNAERDRGRHVATGTHLTELSAQEQAEMNRLLHEAERQAKDTGDAYANQYTPVLSELEQLLVDANEAQLNLNETLDDASDPVTDLIDGIVDANEAFEDLDDNDPQTIIDYSDALTDLDQDLDLLNPAALQAFVAEIDRAGGDGQAILEGYGVIFNEKGQVIGVELVNGLIIGLTGLGERLTAKANSEIADGIAGIKNGYEIKSPSRVFAREVGAPLGDGVVAGFAAALTPTAFNDALAAAAAGVNPNVLGRGGGGVGSTINIINPRTETIGGSVQQSAAVQRVILT